MIGDPSTDSAAVEPATPDPIVRNHSVRPTEAALVLGRRPHPSSSAVATALAHAFLSADAWDKNGLMAAGAAALGARRRWLGPLAAEVLQAYHRPPLDAPRELAAFVAAAPAFWTAAERAAARGASLRIARYIAAPATARTTADPVPRLDGLSDLTELLELTPGELDWFADTKHWNRRARPGPLHHYRYQWRTRPGRVPRLLEIPGIRLRAAQRNVLTSLLSPIPMHDAAHGFVPGRSAATGAERHTGAQMVIALDLSTFFARVTAGRIFGILRQSGFPEAVAHTITGLCTHAVPARIIAAMPAGGGPDERFALRRALAEAHLPQGAPTSPMLANLSIRRLDSRLSGWATAAGAVYTRYADDLSFSGDEQLARRAGAFVRGVGRIVEDEGHLVNTLKTRVRGASIRQTVTGIVVNEHTNVPRREFDRLKAILHNSATYGPSTQNHGQHSDFRAHLLGRISWVESLNAARGRRLREEFARIQW